MTKKGRCVGIAAALAVLLCAWATPSLAQSVARVHAGATQIQFEPVADHQRLVLTVSGPSGNVFRREFDAGTVPAVDISDLGRDVDGSYTYELRVVPRIAPGVKQELAQARKSGDARGVTARLQREGKLPAPLVQSGGFQVQSGTIVPQDVPESDLQSDTGASMVNAIAADQVIPDDLIVQGSACVGLDCVNNENFGFDTIRLKENNLRIHFDDTSTQVGFPANDWRLIANDSASGGSSKFSIEDSTGARTPFTITAGAATNSIFVDSTGRLGLRTSTPVLDLHINTSNTPAIRLEQNNSGGFTAQTWDIGANEANFFVRDVTGGSRLSFRIRPGAPTSSLDISSDGDVGIGTGSPAAKLHVLSGETRLDSTDATLNSHFNFSGNGQNYLRGTTIIADITGNNVGIGCDGPTSKLVIGGTAANCATAPFSSINPGSATFTTSSSRSIKEHLSPVEVPDILEKIAGVNVFKYDFVNGPTDRIGLMAEDFHQVFKRGSDKMINGGEVEMALWLAVQQLNARNQELLERLSALETRLATQGSTQEKAP